MDIIINRLLKQKIKILSNINSLTKLILLLLKLILKLKLKLKKESILKKKKYYNLLPLGLLIATR